MYSLLALRNGEAMQLHRGDEPENPKGKLHRVSLIKIELPNVDFVEHCKPYSVVCIAQYNQHGGAWGWVSLEAATKDGIANYIVGSCKEFGIELDEIINEWLWLDIFCEENNQ